MKITTTGNYLTRDGRLAVVNQLGGVLCFGHIDGTPMCWRMDCGLTPCDDALNIDAPAPMPWRERVLKLIEGASLDPRNWILVNGEFRITTPFTSIVIKRGNDGVELFSQELFEAIVKRRDELWRENQRAIDDANAEAIERILA